MTVALHTLHPERLASKKSLAIWPVTGELATFILAAWNFCHYMKAKRFFVALIFCIGLEISYIVQCKLTW